MATGDAVVNLLSIRHLGSTEIMPPFGASAFASMCASLRALLKRRVTRGRNHLYVCFDNLTWRCGVAVHECLIRCARAPGRARLMKTDAMDRYPIYTYSFKSSRIFNSLFTSPVLPFDDGLDGELRLQLDDPRAVIISIDKWLGRIEMELRLEYWYALGSVDKVKKLIWQTLHSTRSLISKKRK